MLINVARPRRTVRLRLTLLYGGLFLVCGAALLAVTYVLVRGAVADIPPAGSQGGPLPEAPTPPAGPLGAPDLVDQALRTQREDVLHQLLVQSGIALAIMSVLSIALGWLVAGRVLRRLRTITRTTRKISATNLHRRLAIDGPDDELKELGDTIDGLLGRLETSFQAQHQFVSNASHELRTPLARQRTIGQLAVDDPEATVPSLRAAHERILVAGAQQERLIEALLTLARGNAGIEIRRPFDLGELVGEVVATRGQPGIRTTIAAAPVTGHRALAERLVVNLVDNAVLHNTPDGWVDVSCQPRDGRATLVVTNTGPVVPADAVPRLFQPFQRLSATRTGEGLGLGLSIVQAIATTHDATVAATPRPGGGLVVTVIFPATSP